MPRFENNREKEYKQIEEMDLSINDLVFYLVHSASISITKKDCYIDEIYCLNNKEKYRVLIERIKNDK